MSGPIGTPASHHQRQPFLTSRGGLVMLGFLAIGVGLLVLDHWVHVLGVLPYLFLLACPVMHFFMHGRHGHHHHHSAAPPEADAPKETPL